MSQIRNFSTTNASRARKNHYNSLGLTRSATQADVKGAYYELSKVYHPDRNQGETMKQREAHSQKFRDITEAYEILGNVKTRRMYDKGFMGVSPSTSRQSTPEDALHRFYKSRETRHRPPPPDGRTPIYDFDEWSKRHYGAAFKRQQEMKERQAFHAKMRTDDKEDYKQDAFVWGGVVFITLYCLFVQYIMLPGYDTPRVTSKKKNDHPTEGTTR